MGLITLMALTCISCRGCFRVWSIRAPHLLQRRSHQRQKSRCCAHKRLARVDSSTLSTSLPPSSEPSGAVTVGRVFVHTPRTQMAKQTEIGEEEEEEGEEFISKRVSWTEPCFCDPGFWFAMSDFSQVFFSWLVFHRHKSLFSFPPPLT